MPYTSIKPSLPGTPELPGESDAKAKLASIVAAHSLQYWSQDRDTDLNCWADLRSSMDAASSGILELLKDYDVVESECCIDTVEDLIWQFLRDTPRSCEVRSSWYPSGDDQPDYPAEFRVWFQSSGSSCWIRGRFDRSGVYSVRFNFNSNSETRELPLSDDAEAALAWFCDSLVS